MVGIGINGFGRIGRLVCRHVIMAKDQDLKVVAINDLSPPKYLAYLFKHDTVHGKFSGEIDYDADSLIIDGHRIKVFCQRDPAEIPWGSVGAEYICESTGFFCSREKAEAHLGEEGAKYVVISAPPKDQTPMFVVGVNHQQYNGEQIVSNASCTTNCLAPLVNLVHNKFGIKEGLMTTVHSMTANQNTVDGSAKGGKDWRAGRCASQNIIPASTGAAKAVGKVIPTLEGRLTGMSFRVPTPDVSVIDVTLSLEKEINSLDDITGCLEGSENEMDKGIITVTDQPVVSSDFIGDTHSCIVDKEASIMLNNHFVKLVAWYDNEWGYSRRLVDLIQWMHTVNGKET